MDSTIPPGARINIEEVARLLDVSPTPVRESLARLESDGLVDKLALKGYKTTELLDKDELLELYELRLLLEPHAARQAVNRAEHNAFDDLVLEVNSANSYFSATEEVSPWDLSNHDVRFHDMILELAGNETIRQAYARTHCHLHAFRLAYAGTFGLHTIHEHSEVVKAIVANEPEQAEEAMRLHIVSSRDRMLSQF
jgi:DNA-binding GntR family transcriptional regulator